MSGIRLTPEAGETVQQRRRVTTGRSRGATVVDDPELRSQVGQRIEQAMCRAELSNADLANRVGCGRTLVAMWKRGTRHLNISTLMALAAALDVHPAWLLTGEGAPRDDAILDAAWRLLDGTRYEIVQRGENDVAVG